MPTYTVVIKNPVIDREIMRMQTDSRNLALAEALHYSTLHGIASVYSDGSGEEVARFRYGAQAIQSTPVPTQGE